jgi:DNA-binding protein HU-beta
MVAKGRNSRRCILTKEEFVALVAEKGGMTKADAGRAVEAVCDAVTTAMEKGEDVKLPGFGGFEVQERGERQGRNLRTGEAITIAASKVVKFSAGTRLKSAANGKPEKIGTKVA